jgi:hypothetical protein
MSPGPGDRHQHQRSLLQMAQGVVRLLPQRRFVRRGERRLEVRTDQLDLAKRSVDCLEGQCGVLRENLGVVAGGVFGGIDFGDIADAQADKEGSHDHHGKENAERGNGAFRAARQFTRDRLQQHCQPGREPRRCGNCHRGIGRELAAARTVVPEIQK